MMLTLQIIRKALEQFLSNDPSLIMVTVFAEGKNNAIFPQDVLEFFDTRMMEKPNEI